MSVDADVESVAALLEDDTARRIVVETREERLSAAQLSRRCGVSESTVYRRLEELVGAGFLVERVRPDEAGHHEKVYAAALDRVVVEVRDDGFDVELTRTESMSDRFTRLIEEM